MESYRTEEEQIEAIKTWWKKNASSTITGIVVAIALVFGWQAWQGRQQHTAESASMLYQELMIADQKVADNAVNLATVHHLAGQLNTEHGGSLYAQYASLLIAKYAVESGDLEKAEEQLRQVVAKASMEELSQLANLRLARVLFAQDKPEKALAILEGTEPGSFAAGYEELKGDIYLAGEQEQEQEALEAYRKALELTVAAGLQVDRLLEIKLADLSADSTAEGQ